MKASGRPAEILERLNEMAGFAPNEEIQLYEVFSSVQTCIVVCICSCLAADICPKYVIHPVCPLHAKLCLMMFYCLINSRWVQEIKFEPNVMCEHIDKKATFKTSQVSSLSLLLVFDIIICRSLRGSCYNQGTA